MPKGDNLSNEQFNEFRRLLTDHRTALGISQNRLARLVGMDTSHLNRIENGLRPPPKRDTVIAIASALRIDTENLDRLLVTAGHAPLNVEGLVSQHSEDQHGGFGVFRRPSPVATELCKAVSDEIVSLVDDPNIRLRDRRVVIEVIRAIPDYIRGIHNNMANQNDDLGDIEQINDVE